MKHLFFALVLFTTTTLYPQLVGVNGAGFFENKTEESESLFKEAVGNNEFVLRIPGGAIAKFADPTLAKGWGISNEGVDSILALYGSDEEESLDGALEKWKRKASEQPNHSYLDDVIQLSNELPNMKIIYAVNIYAGVDKALYPVEYLIENGVDVITVELGNESYSQVDYDFNKFIELSKPIYDRLKLLGLDVAIPVPATGLRDSKKHSDWISSVNNWFYLDGVAHHPYYDNREFPALESPVDTVLAYEQILAWDFDKQFTDMKNEVPNAKFHIVTESNSQPASLIGDTELNAFLVEKLFESGRKNFESFSIHSGITPDKYGILYGTERTGGLKINKSYYAFADAVNAGAPIFCDSVLTGYTESIYSRPVVVTVQNDLCAINCESFWYRLFNKRFCLTCKPTQEVTVFVNDTILIPEYTEVCDTIINPEPTPVQPIDAAELHFYTESQFEEFLDYHGIASYDVLPPLFANDCSTVPESGIYPSQLNNDWQFEERFTGMPFVSIYDHITTRKHINIFFVDYLEAYGEELDFCGVNEGVKNPVTGQWVIFHDTFNWFDENGQNIFNLNKKLYLIWDIQAPFEGEIFKANDEGVDFSFCSLFPEHCSTVKLNNKNAAVYYGHLKD